MGGFTLAGKTYVFHSEPNTMCMCYGVYGFINESDELELFFSQRVFLYSFEIPGPRGKSARFLPTLILVETIILDSSSVNGGQFNFV